MKNIQEAKTHLSRLVDRAAAGEEIIIAKAGKPMAKLVPYAPLRKPRVGGFLSDKIVESADCWESDPDILEAMTGASIEPQTSATHAAEDTPEYKP